MAKPRKLLQKANASDKRIDPNRQKIYSKCNKLDKIRMLQNTPLNVLREAKRLRKKVYKESTERSLSDYQKFLRSNKTVMSDKYKELAENYNGNPTRKQRAEILKSTMGFMSSVWNSQK